MEFNHYNRKIVSKSSSISKEIKARTSKNNKRTWMVRPRREVHKGLR